MAEGSARLWRAAVVLALLGTVTVAGVGQLGSASVRVQPSNPTTEDAVVVILSGEWEDSCPPSVVEVRVLGTEIQIVTESSSWTCLMVITRWSRVVPLGRLPAGAYTVTVINRERRIPPRVIGWGFFVVQAKKPESLVSIVAGNTAFALDLYRALCAREGNLFLSPYNLSLCLAMAYAGARGRTAEEMARVLRFALPQEELHPAFGALDQALRLRAEQTGVTLTTANAFWGEVGWPFRGAYRALLQEHYGAELFEVPFSTEPEGSRLRINSWVSDRTAGKIPDLLPPGFVGPSTRLVLTSAIYFYGTWKYQFNPAWTAEGDFHLLDGSVARVPMMTSEEMSLRHGMGMLAGVWYEAVELPYTSDAFGMLLIVPERGKFRDFERALTADGLASVVENLVSGNVRVVMPKFAFRSKFWLGEVLAALGMPTAFSPGAEFSGMEETGSLYVGDVIHEAFGAVDEEGTEAAAATGIPFVLSLPPTVSVDRPFLFLIRDRETGTTLFLGRVLDPRG